LSSSSDPQPESCLPLAWPVDGAVSSPFGARDGRAHAGIDLAVAEGTDVRAACDGVVRFAGTERGYGLVVIVRHASGLETLYAHNRELLVRAGEAITRGALVARSGQTGNATAPHVHFEVHDGAVARDPVGYLAPRPVAASK
jgi:murein DD-endopeptidase MepM/ murein hydrolase activator NlpD